MREILLSLDREALPVEYGVSGGSLLERFFVHAVALIVGEAPVPETTLDLTTEDGILFRYHPAVRVTEPKKNNAWVAETSQDSGSSTDWLEVVQTDSQGEQRAAILRMRMRDQTDMFYVATCSEMFITTILLSQTPG